MQLTTPIIPIKQQFYGQPKTLDLKAIAIFAATGFFLDDDTYYTEQKVLKPASQVTIDDATGKVISQKPYFKWHYAPRERPFNEVVDEFQFLFESILDQQVGNRKVILPLSGGLDSRTQAVALHKLKKDVVSYSYRFDGGHDENWYGEQISKSCKFPYHAYQVKEGYLWDCIETLTGINGCYSEFTHPRQMAFLDSYKALGDLFSLGHWGDVLFDTMGISDSMPFEGQVEVLFKKVVKKGGLDLANALWNSWGLEGNFKDYFMERIKELLLKVAIPQSANAQVRAFKSLYWAPRWTSVNLSVFNVARPVSLPYYDNRMCEFICTVPEEYLAHRQIQIDYIKRNSPALAQLIWQAQRPFNLYNYHQNRMPWNLPFRIIDKLRRMGNPKPYVQRNWELQFLGVQNDSQIRHWILENSHFDALVPKAIRQDFYHLFKESDAVFYSHPLSMLLTLSLFSKARTTSI